jgi:microcystin degradation protein MlrC
MPDAAVDELYEMITAREKDWAVSFASPDEAVSEAKRIAKTANRPIVISDTQDNPGAGGDANTTGMLKALVDGKVERAALGVFYDPEAVAAAKVAGVGATIRIALGGRSGVEGDAPYEGAFEVEHLSDGRCVFDGPMLHGTQVDLGGVACLKIDDVRVIVSATKAQMFDRNLYRVGGVQPEQMKILVNKSSVHFRADFGPISEAILIAKAPGPMKADPADLPWTRLSPGMRVSPGGPKFTRKSELLRGNK